VKYCLENNLDVDMNRNAIIFNSRELANKVEQCNLSCRMLSGEMLKKLEVENETLKNSRRDEEVQRKLRWKKRKYI